MKKTFIVLLSVVIFGVVASSEAQTLTKDAVLQNPSGNRVTLGTPASVTNNKILLPGTLGSVGSLLFLSGVAAGPVGSTSWLAPASNGSVLVMIGGAPTWISPFTATQTSVTLPYWLTEGNGNTITDGTNNLLGTTTAAPVRIITGGAARITLSSTGDVLVAGTGGTANFRATSLTSAMASSTGGVLFADATGYINRLAVPAASGQVLTSTTGGALTWASAGSSSGWGLTGNSGTTAGTNFIGTTDAVDWVIKTGGSAASNERARVTAGGRVGVGNISDVRTTVDINGDYGTRYNSIALSDGANNNVNPGSYSYVRLTGPSADFSLTGLRSGANGKRITLYNTTAYTMTIKHENTSSVDTARFYNPIATDLTIYGGGTLSLIYDAVQSRWVVAAYSNGFVPQISSMILRRKAANETLNTSTTFQDDDHLQWPVTAGQIWEVRGTIFVTQTSASPDFKFQFVAPGGTGDSLQLFYKMYKLQGGGGGTLNEAADLLAYSTSSGTLQMNANTYAIDVSGVFVVGSTSGNIIFQWAQGNSDGTNVQVNKNSYLFITRIQ